MQSINALWINVTQETLCCKPVLLHHVRKAALQQRRHVARYQLGFHHAYQRLARGRCQVHRAALVLL